jgi:hypothetical protein
MLKIFFSMPKIFFSMLKVFFSMPKIFFSMLKIVGDMTRITRERMYWIRLTGTGVKTQAGLPRIHVKPA